MVIHALIMSWLNYCNILYLSLKAPWKLLLVQNAIAHLLAGAGRRHHFIAVLQELHWLFINFHEQLKVLVMIFNSFRYPGLMPGRGQVGEQGLLSGGNTIIVSFS